MGFLELFHRFPGDISQIPWRYFIGFFDIYDMCQRSFDGCPGDISSLSWRYLMGLLEIFDRCSGDI